MKKSPKPHHVQHCVTELMEMRKLLCKKKNLTEQERTELMTLLHEAADILIMVN